MGVSEAETFSCSPRIKVEPVCMDEIELPKKVQFLQKFNFTHIIDWDPHFDPYHFVGYHNFLD